MPDFDNNTSDTLSNAANLAALGLGGAGLATYGGARGLTSFLNLGPQPDALWDKIRFASEEMGKLNKEYRPVDWFGGYARAAHDLAAAPVVTADTRKFTGGDVSFNSREQLGTVVRDSIMPKLNKVWDRLPQRVRTFIKHNMKPEHLETAKFWREGNDMLQKLLTNPREFHGSRIHYDDFAKSVGHAHTRLAAEMPDVKLYIKDPQEYGKLLTRSVGGFKNYGRKGYANNDLAGILGEALAMPREERSKYINKTYKYLFHPNGDAVATGLYDDPLDDIARVIGVDSHAAPAAKAGTEAWKDLAADYRRRIGEAYFKENGKANLGELFRGDVMHHVDKAIGTTLDKNRSELLERFKNDPRYRGMRTGDVYDAAVDALKAKDKAAVDLLGKAYREYDSPRKDAKFLDFLKKNYSDAYGKLEPEMAAVRKAMETDPTYGHWRAQNTANKLDARLRRVNEKGYAQQADNLWANKQMKEIDDILQRHKDWGPLDRIRQSQLFLSPSTDEGKDFSTLRRLVNELDTTRDKMLGKLSPAELEVATNNTMDRFLKIMTRNRMYSAPKMYSGMPKILSALNKARHPAVLAGGLGLSALGLTGLLSKGQEKAAGMTKKADGEDSAPLSPAVGGLGVATGLGTAGYFGNSALDQLRRYGLRKHNPFGKVKGLVVGGVTDTIDGKRIPPTNGGSFTSQTRAISEALSGAGMDIDAQAAYRRPRSIKTRGDIGTLQNEYRAIGLDPNTLDKYDFVVQSGAHGDDASLARKYKNRDLLRYRSLSDVGAGNFKQPEVWLGGRNWMKVLDSPDTYHRFIAPGAEQDIINPATGKPFQGNKGNIYVDNLPVNEDMFGKKQWSSTKGIKAEDMADMLKLKDDARASFLKGVGGKDALIPHVMFEQGGGSMSFAPFLDAKGLTKNPKTGVFEWTNQAFPEPIRYNQEQAKKFFTDMYDASKHAYGDNAHLSVLLGDTRNYDTAATRTYENLIKELRASHPNIHFVDLIPQDKLADMRATANGLIQLPGSSTGEQLRMALGKDSKLPGIVNLNLPDDPFFPRHWENNANYQTRNLGAHMYQMQRELDPNRAATIGEMLKDGPTFAEGKGPVTGLKFSGKPIADQILKDVRKVRWQNLGKLVGKGGLAGAGATLAGLGLYNMFNHAD